jgi:uncharacterized protein involved in exopolysaccharide biosynthesis
VEPEEVGAHGSDPDAVDHFLRVVRERFWIVLLVAVSLTAATVGYSLWQEPVYEASIKILIAPKPQGDGPANILQGGNITGLQQVTQTITEAIVTQPVALAVIRNQDLESDPEELLGNLYVEQIGATQFVQVYYRDTDPERAQQVAEAVGAVFSEQVRDLTAGAITASVWEPAETPDTPVGLGPVLNGLVALVAGIMLGIALAFFVDYRGRRKRKTTTSPGT